ncbi:MAG TPA: sigma-54 dependent transcriptional regulator [Gammaproteobacteria bacterium]|nr:sigma-54 dependent transcriptional regulator [Gammaproteobacteria bacterium]
MRDQRGLLYYRPKEEAQHLLPALSNAGWDVRIAETADEASDALKENSIKVGLAALDSDLATNDVHEYLRPVDGPAPCGLEWIALLEEDRLESSSYRSLIAEHFYDYHTLPADITRLLVSLGHAYGMAQILSTQSPVGDGERSDEPEMVGASGAIQAVFEAIRKVASVDAAVLITGESGTGKELAARAIHERSTRAGQPFIAVNCGALPVSLIQSELFGHEKGSFTGAYERKIGFIEAAAGGTLFLDEIGDLPLDLQVNLLRFLQEGTIQRIGSRERLHVDARIIAATRVDLEQAVAENRFREDLYYRLNVLGVHMPPLREREEDIELLARYFFEQFSKERRRRLRGFSDAALKAMRRHDWSGNVRELINRVRRAIVMCDGKLVCASDLGLGREEVERRIVTLEEARAQAEREAIRSALGMSGKNVSLAARSLGVSRVTLYRLMYKYNIQT